VEFPNSVWEVSRNFPVVFANEIKARSNLQMEPSVSSGKVEVVPEIVVSTQTAIAFPSLNPQLQDQAPMY
jgi:hypothetical protein